MAESGTKMIDTHSHMLPWVDHGCPDLPTALNMARAAADSGARYVVCTPHYPEWNAAKTQYAREVMERLRAALTNSGIELRIALGFEVDLSVAVLVEHSKLRELTVEGSRGVIVFEMPYTGWPPYIEETIFKLATTGFVPVLAHPERNDRVQESSDPLMRCVRGGAVVQATAGSLSGEFGNGAIRTFHRLLSEGLVSLLATDAHSYRQENWTMGPMLEMLQGRVSDEDLVRLTATNPRLLMQGRPLQTVAPAMGGLPSGWRKRRWGKG